MYKWRLVLLLLVLATACKGKKSLAGDEKIDADDFFEAFATISLPNYYADTNLLRKADTLNISLPVFSQFVPDSALQKITAKNNKKVTIHPIGKIEKENELYLLTNFTQNKKTKLVAFAFDKNKKFKSSIELVSNKNDDGYVHSVAINKEPTFMVSKEKYTPDNQLQYTRQGFAFNTDAGAFLVVVNDSNEDLKKLSEILNPLDTLPRKNKFSADYAQDKKNFISVRDGKNSAHYLFFIHFEKNDGTCTGELKGGLTMVSETKAVFKESGDPCVIDFSFGNSSITVKEQGSCGNHRGIKCYFNDTYNKKKEPKKKKTK